MIKPNTLDEAIVEAHRFIKAAKALRFGRMDAADGVPHDGVALKHAAALRASMDLTRKLADLRQSR